MPTVFCILRRYLGRDYFGIFDALGNDPGRANGIGAGDAWNAYFGIIRQRGKFPSKFARLATGDDINDIDCLNLYFFKNKDRK
jgi:hypothetical protein